MLFQAFGRGPKPAAGFVVEFFENYNNAWKLRRGH